MQRDVLSKVKLGQSVRIQSDSGWYLGIVRYVDVEGLALYCMNDTESEAAYNPDPQL